MSKTLLAYIGTGDEDFQQIIAYFEKLGIRLPVLKKEDLHNLSIEVRDVPEIMAVLEHRDYFRSDPKKIWQIIKITDEGITFYLVNHSGSKNEDAQWKECYIFIPKENIVAIHTIDQVFLDNIKNR